MYIVLASSMGAKDTYPEAVIAEKAEADRKTAEATYLFSPEAAQVESENNEPLLSKLAKYISWAALLSCLYMGIMSYVNQDIETITTWLIVPTLIYFVTATYAYLAKSSNEV
jgi:NCS1 family nucleobase:cation symporter-1